MRFIDKGERPLMPEEEMAFTARRLFERDGASGEARYLDRERGLMVFIRREENVQSSGSRKRRMGLRRNSPEMHKSTVDIIDLNTFDSDTSHVIGRGTKVTIHEKNHRPYALEFYSMRVKNWDFPDFTASRKPYALTPANDSIGYSLDVVRGLDAAHVIADPESTRTRVEVDEDHELAGRFVEWADEVYRERRSAQEAGSANSGQIRFSWLGDGGLVEYLFDPDWNGNCLVVRTEWGSEVSVDYYMVDKRDEHLRVYKRNIVRPVMGKGGHLVEIPAATEIKGRPRSRNVLAGFLRGENRVRADAIDQLAQDVKVGSVLYEPMPDLGN